MTKQQKQTWLDALRSGKYQQGANFLRNAIGQYCCLGVYCEANYPGSLDTSFDLGTTTTRRFIGYDLPRRIDLASMNDEGASFVEIADWIEANIVTED